ncbi:MAG TPA: DUF1361 domain-containing protein [Armatimonadota bacterium]|nr:DUF1361 domain-containing protein [Armatimonadota bacterium]
MLVRIFGHAVSTDLLTHWIGWNLFLAIIPVGLGYLMLAVVERRGPKNMAAASLAIVLIFLAWLAFVPNTCYLITEWKHFLDNVVSNDLYRDSVTGSAKLTVCLQALFYFFYSGAGVLCFVLALRPVERALRHTKISFTAIAAPLFMLISLGVYLGRVVRLNSWDLVTRPGRVFNAVGHVFTHRILIVVVVMFGLLLWGLYEALDIWMDGVSARWKQWRLDRAQRL